MSEYFFGTAFEYRENMKRTHSLFILPNHIIHHLLT